MRLRRHRPRYPGQPAAPSRGAGPDSRSGRHAAGGAGALARSLGGAALAIVVVLAGIAVTNLVGAPRATTAPSAGVEPLVLPAGPDSAGPAASPTASLLRTATASPAASPGATSGASPGATPTGSPTAAAPPPLVVLNDSRIAGLAARAAGVLRAAGWPVVGVGNLPAMVPESTVFYDPGQEQQAARLVAAGLGIRIALPRGSFVPDAGPLVVVVTRDFPPA